MTMASSSRNTPSPAVKFALSNESCPTEEKNETMTKTPLHNTTIDQGNRSLAAFTPVLTPKGDRTGSMILLSPSRTITETLTALAASTGHQLEEVWDEVGYSPEDRASQLSDLLVKFRDLCEEKIAEERGVAETFRQTIVEAKDEIKRTATALKMTADPYLLQEHPNQTLTDELTGLEAALENLRVTAKAAREELKDCRNYIIESHEALGMDVDPKWRDIESDLTTARREEFHRKKAEMKEEIGSRMAAIIQLVRDCQHLMSDLKIEAERDGSETDRRIAGSLVRSKDGSFIMASKFRSDTCIGISSIAMEELTKRAAQLHTEKRRRKQQLQEMGAEIATLWEKLRVPEEEQLAFTESVQGLGMDTIEKGRTELNRLKDLKSKMIGKLIREARETVADLWNQIEATEDFRSTFPAYSIGLEDSFTDDLLDRHEEYIGRLTSRLEEMRPILRLIDRREVIVRERIEYEELQKDSDRLLKKKSAEMTKNLMEEEKMARRIKRELPRLTEMLVEKLCEWKEKHGEDFQYHGEAYLDTMEQQEQAWHQYKEEELERKKKKKQEEQRSINEGRFGPSQSFKRHGIKKARDPLGDAHSRQNRPARNPVGGKQRLLGESKNDTRPKIKSRKGYNM